MGTHSDFEDKIIILAPKSELSERSGEEAQAPDGDKLVPLSGESIHHVEIGAVLDHRNKKGGKASRR
jgi:hypothetical protein